MAHADGTVESAELFPVAEACGLTSDQVRSCLRRMVAEGLFSQVGGGRTASYRPTAVGERALATFHERTRLAYAEDLAGRGLGPPLAPRRLRHPRVTTGRRATRSATASEGLAAPSSTTASTCRPIGGRTTSPRRSPSSVSVARSPWPAPTSSSSGVTAIPARSPPACGRSTCWRLATSASSTTTPTCRATSRTSGPGASTWPMRSSCPVPSRSRSSSSRCSTTTPSCHRSCCRGRGPVEPHATCC